MTSEEKYRAKNTYENFRREIQNFHSESKLNPRRYSSMDELFLGILEEMGLNEEFKNNPQARKDLPQIVKMELEKIGMGDVKLREQLGKQLSELTEQDVQYFKEGINDAERMKVESAVYPSKNG